MVYIIKNPVSHMREMVICSLLRSEALARYSSIAKGYQEMIEYVKSKLLQKTKRDSSAKERRVAQRER